MIITRGRIKMPANRKFAKNNAGTGGRICPVCGHVAPQPKSLVQLAYMFGEKAVADERKRKIERLRKRIDAYNEK